MFDKVIADAKASSDLANKRGTYESHQQAENDVNEAAFLLEDKAKMLRNIADNHGSCAQDLI